MSSSVIVVDPRVSGYRQLVAGLGASEEVHVLDLSRDGVVQISEWLVGRTEIDALHIVAHGAPALLTLGATVLDLSSMREHRNALSSWGDSLSSGADILLYGCEVAAGPTGREFLVFLADLTRADVAASVDATGADRVGANLVLEVMSGSIEASTLDLELTGTLGSSLALPPAAVPGDNVNHPPTLSFATGKLEMPIGALGEWGEGESVVVQPDGRFLVAGFSFNGANGYSVFRFNPDGSLDPSFSGDGQLTSSVGDQVQKVLLQTDGKIVLTGYGDGTNGFSAFRFNPDGSPDTGFSGDGIATTGFGGLPSDGLLQPDGKIVVAGSGDGWTGYALARFNSDGTPDQSFSGDGLVVQQASAGYNRCYAAAVQLVGLEARIVAVGDAFPSADFSGDGDVGLIRFNSDGSVDTTFGVSGSGVVTTDLGTSRDSGNAVAVQPDGKIVVAAASADNDFILLRYDANGALDGTFSGDGIAVESIGFADTATSLALQADGKIVVVGSSESDSGYHISIARFDPDGTLDGSFSGDGVDLTHVSVGTDFALDVKVQADGRILVSGVATIDGISGVALVRYNADGSLDTSFGSEPVASYGENGNAVLLPSPSVMTDPELAVAGNYAGATITLARNGGANPQDTFVGMGNLSALIEGQQFSLSSDSIGTVTRNSDGSLVLTFDSQATQARVDETLASLGYANQAEAPPDFVRLDWIFNDGNLGAQGSGGALSATAHTGVVISAVNDDPVGNLALRGAPVVGRVLTAAPHLSDADGMPAAGPGAFQYRWFAGDVQIEGAAGQQFKLTAAQVGKSVRAEVSYIDAGDTTEKVLSSPTTIVTESAPLTGIAYHWKSHALLGNVQVAAIDKGLTDSGAQSIDLRAAQYDPLAGTLAVEVWGNPSAAAGNFNFVVRCANAQSILFNSALASDWTIVADDQTAGQLSVGGISQTGIASSAKLGSLTIQLATGAAGAEIALSSQTLGSASAPDQTFAVAYDLTDSSGEFLLGALPAGNYPLNVKRLPSDSGSGVTAAVTSADALAALRISVGINPNPDPDGAGPLAPRPVSPYQFMAADANGNGSVTASDALAILRMSVNSPIAPAQEWMFVEETRDFWNESTSKFVLTNSSAAWDRSIQAGSLDGFPPNLVGVLKGDVNGSWSAPAGSQDLDVSDPTYFQDLAMIIGVPTTAQWGI